jgi:hypothetical protein
MVARGKRCNRNCPFRFLCDTSAGASEHQEPPVRRSFLFRSNNERGSAQPTGALDLASIHADSYEPPI